MIQDSNEMTFTLRTGTYWLTREHIDAMREWVSDCQWTESFYGDDDWVDELSDMEIVRGVNRTYDGGIKNFLRSM
jgi:hypothetical protein